METILDRPIRRGLDQAINECIETLEAENTPGIFVCDKTEKMASQEEES